MPTILYIRGWRFFFYANERNEPIHVHCEKAEREGKYWIDRENFDAIEDFSHNMGPRDRREVKRLIFEYFEDIERCWDEFQARKK